MPKGKSNHIVTRKGIPVQHGNVPTPEVNHAEDRKALSTEQQAVENTSTTVAIFHNLYLRPHC